MESRSMTMESSGEDAILIETVKNIVTQREECNESENDFFLVSRDQDERYSGEKVKETTPHDKAKEILAWIDHCRTCANACDNLIPIFEGEGVEHDLPSKILKHLPIHVSKSDTLPLQLCHDCAGTLLAWHELSEGCLSAEKKLLKMQETLQNNKQQYYSTSLDNFEVSTLVTPITPAIASNTSNSQSDQQIDDAKNEAQGAEEINKSNRLNNQIMHNRTTAYSHSRQRYKIFAEKHRNKINSMQTEAFNITINKNLKNISLLTSNIANDQPIECLSSQINMFSKMPSSDKFTSVKQKRKNTKYKGANLTVPTPVSCAKMTKDVPREYMNESNVCLKRHVKHSKTERIASIDDDATMICELCNKKFPSRKSYWAHTRTHTRERSYTCHVCGKQFIQGGSLYYHLKHVHDGVKNHACDICGRSFAMKTAMEDHRRIHTGERPYVCHTCGKTFKTKASLYIHSRTHTDEFPHKCIYCAKRFRWRQQMLGHLTVHTGEKNHTCDVCGKGFGVKNDLTRHKRVHSEEKPYTCQRCGISFGQKRYLKSHERLRSGMCGYSQQSSRIESDKSRSDND